jgi:outer membrane protein assembly factor BamB
VSRRRALAGTLAALSVVVFAGCAADRPDPKKLETFEPRIAGRQVWSARLDAKVTFPLGVVVRDGRFHVADNDGNVLALDAETGREAWRARAGAPPSAATAVSPASSRATTRSSPSMPVASSGASACRRASSRRRWWPASASS